MATTVTLFEYLCDDGRLYRYVGTIWGPNEETAEGFHFAEVVRGQPGTNVVDSPDQDGFYIYRSGDIAYRGHLKQETVLELLDEAESHETPSL